jgi:hypothetical protein
MIHFLIGIVQTLRTSPNTALRRKKPEKLFFGDPMELDFDVESGEERWTYVGESRAGRVLTVLFTTRGEQIRVVTAFVPSPMRMRIYLEWRAKPL